MFELEEDKTKIFDGSGNYDKNYVYLRVIEFAKAAVNDEIKELDEQFDKIKNLSSKRMSPNVYAKIRFIKRGHLKCANENIVITELSCERKLANLKRDYKTLNDLYKAIDAILNNSSKSQDEKDTEVVEKMTPFFTSYENVYEGSSNTFDVKKGQSQFNKIMSRTNKYVKLGRQIDALEEKVNLYNQKRKNYGRKTNAQSRALANRVNRLRQKRDKEYSKQKIIMMRRQKIVEERNKRIADITAKSYLETSEGNLKKAGKLEAKVEKLKNKKLRQRSGNMILFTEFMKAFATKRKYDKTGNLEKRTWAQRREEALLGQSTKKL